MQGIQEKISSGNKINRASDDPMGAVNLSAAKDQKTKIEQYVKNSDVAFMRLDLSDKTLDEMTSVLTRMTELSLQLVMVFMMALVTRLSCRKCATSRGGFGSCKHH